MSLIKISWKKNTFVGVRSPKRSSTSRRMRTKEMGSQGLGLKSFLCRKCDLVFSDANVFNLHTLVHAAVTAGFDEDVSGEHNRSFSLVFTSLVSVVLQNKYTINTPRQLSRGTFCSFKRRNHERKYY